MEKPDSSLEILGGGKWLHLQRSFTISEPISVTGNFAIVNFILAFI